MGLSLSNHPRTLTATLLWVALGLFFWTLIEYASHRHIFHLIEVKQPWRDLFSGGHLAHLRRAEVEELILAPAPRSPCFRM